MQEKAKEKRSSKLTARLQARDVSVSRRRLQWVVKSLILGGIAYLIGLGELLFDSRPLGIALLCACSGGQVVGILGGLILAELMLMQQPVLMIATYAAAALIRVVTSLLLDPSGDGVRLPAYLRKARGETAELPEGAAAEPRPRGRRAWRQTLQELFCESLRLRMAAAAAGMLVISLSRLIGGGFRYYDLFAALFSVAVAPAATVVFSVRLERRSQSKLLRALSALALMFAVVWSANHAAIAGVPVSAIAAVFFTLCVATREGVWAGAVTGLLCGLAFAPMQIPACLIAAIIAGGKWKKPELTGIPLATLAAWLWSLYTAPAEAVTVYLPAYLAAGTAQSLVWRIRRAEAGKSPSAAEQPLQDPQTALRCERSRHEDSNDRFRNISDAFSALSEMFYNLSDRLKRPGTLDLRRICDSSFDSFCSECPNKPVCWGLEYSDTLAVMGELISHLHTKGKVTSAQIPAPMRRRCRSMEQILRQINTDCAKLTGELLRNNRTEIFAMDYEAAANIINDALAEDAGEYRFDTEPEARLNEYLADAGITAQSISVFGMRRRQILLRGVNIDRATVTMETLRSDLGEMCGLELGMPTFEVEDHGTTMSLQAKRKLSVIAARYNLSADGGVSGDSINLFSNKKDYFYALISDGMGAGKAAAFTSNLCSVFLEKMLRAGNRASTSLRMLNNLILSRCGDSSEECSSTIDLIELDLITGSAGFIKGGAAPSFVLRGGTVHRLQAGTAPIGIIPALDTQCTEFDLRAGDTVVMISDGIMQGDPECHRLVGYLSDNGDAELETLVEEICRYATEGGEHDDCSAVALRILPAQD